MDRGQLLGRVAPAMGGIVAGMTAMAALIHAFAPVLARRPLGRWRPVGRLADFDIGEVVPARVALTLAEQAGGPNRRHVYVWRPDAERTVVFSRHCTNLSGPVMHDPGSGWFYCPDHGGVFNAEGEPLAGPPDRPLSRYAMRVRNGLLEIDLESLPATPSIG